MLAQSKTNVLLAVVVFGLAGLAHAVRQINDLKAYPPCLVDQDCEDNKNLKDHVCFQYFCYPWKQTAVEVTVSRPLESCRMSRDCPKAAGPTAAQQICFRHHDKRQVTNGICIDSRDECLSHDECDGKGDHCCNGYCCNKGYFEALKKFSCVSDEGCQVRTKDTVQASIVYVVQMQF